MMSAEDPPSDALLLNEATGYYELGMFEDAAQALAGLTSAGARSEAALDLRCTLCVARRDWTGALLGARDFVAWHAGTSQSWFWLGYSARRALSAAAAYEAMRPAAGRFHENPVVDYNLACYAALSGNSADAMELLTGVLARNPAWLETAWKDEDLQALRPWLAGLPPLPK